MDWITLTTGADPRPLVAPEAMLALTALSTSVWSTADPELLELARARIAMLLRDPEAIERRPRAAPALPAEKMTSLADWPTSPLYSETERVALSFTERFVIDVAGIGDADRVALFAELPAESSRCLRRRAVCVRLRAADRAGHRSPLRCEGDRFPGSPSTAPWAQIRASSSTS